MSSKGTKKLALVVIMTLAGCSSNGTGTQPQADTGVASDGANPDTGTTYFDQGQQQNKKTCWYFCNTVAECPKGAVACTNKVCIECTNNSHCQKYPSKQCDTVRGLCLVCTQDSHCTYQGKKIYSGKCAAKLGLCVRCATSADCNWPNSATKICAKGLCIQCQNDGHCTGAPMKRCDPTGFCSLCKTNAECCPPGQPCGLTCDTQTGYCLCGTAKQCSDLYPTSTYKWECKAN